MRAFLHLPPVLLFSTVFLLPFVLLHHTLARPYFARLGGIWCILGADPAAAPQATADTQQAKQYLPGLQRISDYINQQQTAMLASNPYAEMKISMSNEGFLTLQKQLQLHLIFQSIPGSRLLFHFLSFISQMLPLWWHREPEEPRTQPLPSANLADSPFAGVN